MASLMLSGYPGFETDAQASTAQASATHILWLDQSWHRPEGPEVAFSLA